jgi:hypothetical protein
MNIEELAVTLKMLGYTVKLLKQYKLIILIAPEPLLEVEKILEPYPNFSFDYRYKFPSNSMWICEGQLKKTNSDVGKVTWQK